VTSDTETKTVSLDFGPGGWKDVGHDNRIFAVRFIDDHTLISGGWDSVVHIWDTRTGKSARHFKGPNISGESLTYENGMILAGCYEAKNQIQFWDIKTCKKVEEIDWTGGDADDAEYIYAAAINKRHPNMFGAGSTGPNSEVRVYKEKGGNPHEHIPVMTLKGLSQGCLSLDFSSKHNHLAFTTPHHGLYIYEY
jgi:WD40 repeat protein